MFYVNPNTNIVCIITDGVLLYTYILVLRIDDLPVNGKFPMWM